MECAGYTDSSLSEVCRKMKGAYFVLFRLAEQGSRLAAENLVDLLTAQNEKLLLACSSDQQSVFLEIAPRRRSWPALKIVDGEPQWLRCVFERLRLGEQVGLKFRGKIARAPESLIVRDLFEVIETIRLQIIRGEWPHILTRPLDAITKAKVMVGVSGYPMKPRVYRIMDRRARRAHVSDYLVELGVYRKLCHLATTLPTLSRKPDAQRPWWSAVWLLFKSLYGPDYHNHPRLLGRRKNKRFADLSKKQQTRAIRDDIRKKLKQSLRSIAAKNIN
jgi:hypothetical protein